MTSNEILPGQYYDQETNLHFNWNRYYMTDVGRYNRSDPFGLNGGLNTYTYAMLNPLSHIDMNGLVYGPGQAGGIDEFEKGITTKTQLSTVNGSVSIGAGGSGMLMMVHSSADSGVSVGSNGSFCFYSTICKGVGANNPLAGELGLVGSISSGKLCSGQKDQYFTYWAGGEGIIGEGQLSINGSYGRGLLGIGGSPGNALYGAGIIKCSTTYICPYEGDNCKCKDK